MESRLKGITIEGLLSTKEVLPMNPAFTINQIKDETYKKFSQRLPDFGSCIFEFENSNVGYLHGEKVISFEQRIPHDIRNNSFNYQYGGCLMLNVIHWSKFNKSDITEPCLVGIFKKGGTIKSPGINQNIGREIIPKLLYIPINK